MSAWVGITPWLGAGSLDGFAFGALMSGACLVAIAVSRRTRKRHAAASGRAALAAGGPDWLCEHVMAAEAFGADAERLVLPEGLDDGPVAPSGPGGRAAGGYRSRHRLGDPLPSVPAPGLVSQDGYVGAAVPEEVLPAEGSRPGALPGAALPGSAIPAGTSRPAAFPESAFRGAHRDAALPDLAFPDGTFGTGRRPEARRLPRHAAPGVGFSRRLSGLMASLAAARALLGAHG
ncbi:MAG TPA: hypothetical protein VMI33_26740 [Streptosporangiaceae bacterium]|nr:hypothetical protein [Streptosporangiaceae bacterium]